MQARKAYTVGMQYTLRKIPPSLDSVLRRRAAEERKSLNQVVLEALMRTFGIEAGPVKQRDLGDIAGNCAFDPEVEKVLEEQRTIDTELWS